MTQLTCQSCTMPIESGTLCKHCGDERGELRPFDELFTRMMMWTRKNEPKLSESEAEARTLAFMASMPAWKDNPALKQRLASA